MFHQWDAAHTRDPDHAARVLVEKVLLARAAHVDEIAHRLLRAGCRPISGEDLVDSDDLGERLDPTLALLAAADTDQECEWPVGGTC